MAVQSELPVAVDRKEEFSTIFMEKNGHKRFRLVLHPQVICSNHAKTLTKSDEHLAE
jgi:hypothetical protein